jgi:hypothetical protein
MPKGMFTQGICVLLEKPPSLDEIESLLSDFDILRRVEASTEWVFGGPTVIVGFRPEVNGLVSVDVVNKCWPDHMGDPKTETMLFGAWSMGHFGPFAYPGGLQRATQQCWAWERGKSVADGHKAFVRIRSSYAFGAQDDDPIMPADYEAYRELEFVTKVASALLELPGSLCYFNPNGEVLRDQDGLRECLNFGWSNELPPFDAWMNIRLFNVNAEWSFMDTVGGGQLDIPDAEASFHAQSFDFGEVDNFLRNVSLYLLNNGEIIEDGDTMDGPGEIRWHSRQYENGVCDPPRRVLRWLPVDGRPVPPEIMNAGESV